MLPPQCFFCKHINPAGAKFCNDCGSPLHLKPCRQCEAINDQAAKYCYKCGKDDPALVSPAEALPVSLLGSAAESLDVLSRRHDEATPQDCEPCVEVIAPEPRPPGRDTSSPVSGNSGAASLAPLRDRETAPRQRPRARAALAGLPPAALLVALALSASYAYLHPLQLREWLSAKRTAPDENRGGAPGQSIPGKDGVPATSASAVNLDAGSTSVATSATGTPSEPSTDTAASPVHQDETATKNPQQGAEQTPPPNPSANEASAAATPVTAQPREVTPPAAQEQPAPKNAATNRSIATAPTAAPSAAHLLPRDSRAALPSRVGGPSGCPTAGAAPGSCSAKKTATNAKTSAKKSKKTPTKKPGSSQATPAPVATPAPAEAQPNAQSE